jgi:hypothetical protein
LEKKQVEQHEKYQYQNSCRNPIDTKNLLSNFFPKVILLKGLDEHLKILSIFGFYLHFVLEAVVVEVETTGVQILVNSTN